MNNIPIFTYHAISNKNDSFIASDKGELIYALSSEDFEQQIDYLYHSGYNTIYLDNINISKGNKESHPDFGEKNVIITFDDGHISNYTHAYLILQKYGFIATFFVTIKNINTPNGMRYEHLRQMCDNGMSIMSHTMTHAFLSDIPTSQILWELQESKKILENELGRPVSYLSLPGGRCSKVVKEIAKEVGYKGICTSIVGYNYPNTDPYSLRRWTITRNMSFSTFQAIAEGKKSTLVYYKSRQFLLNGMKKIIGNKLYASIHKEITSGMRSNTETQKHG